MQRNIVYIALSVFGVQGAAYLGQFILAGLLPAEQFAIVRTVEASLQLLSAIAPIGVSLLVIRLAAQTSDPIELGRSLSSYLAFALVVGIAIAGISSLLIAAFGERNADLYLLSMVWVLVLSNVSRTALNFLHGKERFAIVSTTSFIIALCYLAALTALVKLVGLPGWIGAKYLIESALLLVGMGFVWRHLGWIIGSARFYAALAHEGAAVSLSLLFRTGLDTMPLLLIAYLGMGAKDVATFGLCTLIVTAALILSSSINTVLLPKFARVFECETEALRTLHLRSQNTLMIVGLLMYLIVVAAGWAIDSFDNNKFNNLSLMLVLLSTGIPLKSIGSLNANILFSNKKTVTGTKIHAISLIVAACVVWFLVKSIGVWGAVAGSLVGEIVAFVLLFASARKELGRDVASFNTIIDTKQDEV